MDMIIVYLYKQRSSIFQSPLFHTFLKTWLLLRLFWIILFKYMNIIWKINFDYILFNNSLVNFMLFKYMNIIWKINFDYILFNNSLVNFMCLISS
jgi:hypothetical protein